MNKLKAFASALILVTIITPATALADGGYNDSGDGDDGLFVLGFFIVIIAIAFIASLFGPKKP